MADPAKLAALKELADTGTYSGAQQNLGASRDAALAQQSSLGSLIGAPTAATASTMPVIQQPYGRFADALSQYQTADELSEANLAAANDQYFSQVANAQSAHRAEADRAIAEAQRAYGSSTAGGGDLSQWEIEARATALGDDYQQQAAAEEAQVAVDQTKAGADAELEAQLQAWREMGEADAASERYVEHAVRNNPQQQATEDEKARAAAQWESENPLTSPVAERRYESGSGDTYTTEGRTPFEDFIIQEQRRQARDAWVDQNAGSDRFGTRDAREQAYRNEVEARNAMTSDDVVTLSDGTQLATPGRAQPGMQEVDDYLRDRSEAAEQAIQNQQMLELYKGGQFKTQAALDLNLLGPDVPDAIAELQYRGMFPEQTPEEQMDDALKRRELAYFEETGFANPQDQRSWEEAERKRAGLPDPNNRQVRDPDDPDVLAAVGMSPEEVAGIRSDKKWEEILGYTEEALNPSDEEAVPVQSLAELRFRLEEAGYSPQMIDLVSVMYDPAITG